MAATGAPVNNTIKKATFKNCALFFNCINKINNTHVDDTQDTHMVCIIK